MIKNETWDLKKTALTKVLIVARTKLSSYVIKFDVSPFIHLLFLFFIKPQASTVMFSNNNNVKRINKVNCIIAHFLYFSI